MNERSVQALYTNKAYITPTSLSLSISGRKICESLLILSFEHFTHKNKYAVV